MISRVYFLQKNALVFIEFVNNKQIKSKTC